MVKSDFITERIFEIFYYEYANMNNHKEVIMTEMKKDNKEDVVQKGPVCNCIIMAGVFKLVNLIKRLFNKSDNKSV